MHVLKSKVTKQSDHFVWKNTSERVARRCDDTVDKKRVNSCVQQTPLFGGSWATNKIAKTPRKRSFRRATNVTFSKFRGSRRQKIPVFFENHDRLKPVLIYRLMISLIRINSRGFNLSINELINSNQVGAKDSQKLFSSLVETSQSTAAKQYFSHVNRAVGQLTGTSTYHSKNYLGCSN